MNIKLTQLIAVLASISLCACHGFFPGPDKQFQGSLSGAAVGAGTGAVTGFHLSSGTGAGAAVGAGLGAVAGGIQGMVKDSTEAAIRALEEETQKERRIALAHTILNHHYERRIDLHPTRDIFPADWFFFADEVRLCNRAEPLVDEIVRMNKERYPWSRFVVALYVQSRDENSTYASYLAEERAKELGNQFVRAGIEPRRIETRAVVVEAPVLIDPSDRRDRYSQAVELIPVDR